MGVAVRLSGRICRLRERFNVRLIGFALKLATKIVMVDHRKVLHPFDPPRFTYFGNCGWITPAVALVEKPAIFTIIVCIAHFRPYYLNIVQI
jgi:hypothetical protein